MFFDREITDSEDFKISITEYSDKVPVTAADVMGYLNYTSTSKNAEILRMIQSAVMQIERFTGITIVEKTYYLLYRCVGQRARLINGPLISVESVISTGSTLTIDQYYVKGDYVFPNSYFSTTAISGQPYLEATYKAGMLRPMTVSDDVITLVGHGYSDGDEVGIYGVSGATEGTLYTVQSATADTFEIGETLVDGDGFVGIMPPLFKEGIIMQAAENFLRGEASAGLTTKVKNHIYSLKEQVMY